MGLRGRTRTRFGARRAVERAGDDQGAVAVIVAISMVVLIGVAALAVDVGSLYAERRALQTAADAGALAGVQELPASPGMAVSVAQTYVASNAPQATNCAVSITSDLAANDTIQVIVTTGNSPLFFARIWGRTSSAVSATGVARITSPVAYGSGVMPIGVVATGTTDAMAAFGYTFGDQVRLKTPGGNGETGNYDFISVTPGEPGSTNYLRDVISAGGTGPVYVGQLCKTGTGNKPPAVHELADRLDSHSFAEICPPPDENGVVHVNDTLDGEGGCPRLILVPIVVHADDTCTSPIHPYDWPSGASTPMRVIGFAQFFVLACGSTGNDAWIDGLFVQTVAGDVLATAPYGSSGQVHYALIR